MENFLGSTSTVQTSVAIYGRPKVFNQPEISTFNAEINQPTSNDHLTVNSSQKSSTVSQTHTGKVAYRREIDQLRLDRQILKRHAEDRCKQLEVDMEMEYRSKLQDVARIDKLILLNRDLLKNIEATRKQTGAVCQQDTIRCRSLLQQIGQPHHCEEICTTKKAIEDIIRKLRH